MTDALTPNSPIDQLADRYLEQYVALQPAAATFMGIAGQLDQAFEAGRRVVR